MQPTTLRRDAAARTLALLASLAALLTACGGDARTSPVIDTTGTTPPPGGRVATVSIAVDQDRPATSPLIYGSNQDDGQTRWTIRRYGGNRLTGYNWENNFSSAGSDYQQSSDDFLLWSAGLPTVDTLLPA